MLELVSFWFIVACAAGMTVMGFIAKRRTGTWTQPYLTAMIWLLALSNGLLTFAHGKYPALQITAAILAIALGVISLAKNVPRLFRKP
jgi:hypothetical protein